jgi:hypothetical protein
VPGVKRRRRPRAAGARRGNPEETIQIEVVARLRRAGVRFFHCPNGSKATAAYRAKLWTLGLEAGVPDIVIVTPPPCRSSGPRILKDPDGSGRDWWPHGAALELKAPKGRASDEQKQWLSDLASLGWATAVTYGLDEALAQLRAWGYIA